VFLLSIRHQVRTMRSASVARPLAVGTGFGTCLEHFIMLGMMANRIRLRLPLGQGSCARGREPVVRRPRRFSGVTGENLREGQHGDYRHEAGNIPPRGAARHGFRWGLDIPENVPESTHVVLLHDSREKQEWGSQHVRQNVCSKIFRRKFWRRTLAKKNADVREHPGEFPHVGILIIKPPGHGPDQTGRVALWLIIRRLHFGADERESDLSTRFASARSKFYQAPR